MPQSLRIQDGYGHTWTVSKGDPAWAAVRKLRALGYTWLVLPVSVLAGRAVREPVVAEPSVLARLQELTQILAEEVAVGSNPSDAG